MSQIPVRKEAVTGAPTSRNRRPGTFSTARPFIGPKIRLDRSPINPTESTMAAYDSCPAGLFQRAGLFLQRHLAFSFGQSLKEALPEAGGAPHPRALVGRFPRAVLPGHRPPGGLGAHHPQDAGEHRAVIVARPSPCRLLRREDRRDAMPLGVGQPRLDHWRWRSGAGGRWGLPAECATCGVRASGDRLVGPAPPRPPEPEGPALRGIAHGQDQPTHLWHRERDQTGVGAPFCPRSSCCAAWRMTTR